MEDIGLRIDIPPGAVAKDKKLRLTVQPCLSGPFILPEDHELVSPVYMIETATDFSKGVHLSIEHCLGELESEDCGDMTFISAPSTPTCTTPEYKFSALQNGVFEKGSLEGTIVMNHFCAVGIAKRRSQGGPSRRKKGTKLLWLGGGYFGAEKKSSADLGACCLERCLLIGMLLKGREAF